MLEDIRFALGSIWAHKMRSFLTMLGVIIGIASIIGIVSTIKGTNEQIMKNLIGAGNNNVNIMLKQGDYDYYMGNGSPEGVLPVTKEQKDEIFSLDGVEDASFYNSRTYGATIAAGVNTLDAGTLYGVDSHYLNTCGYVVYKGRPFVEEDFNDRHKVVLLDEKSATTLFPESDPVGGIVEISGEPFTVIGVYRKAAEFQPVIESYSDYQTYNQESYGTALVPQSVWPVLFSFDEPENCVVRASTPEMMSEIGKNADRKSVV